MENFHTKMYHEALEMRGFEIPPPGKFTCPECGVVYEPTYKTYAAARKTKVLYIYMGVYLRFIDLEASEQWLSHICSTKCWKAYLGVPEDVEIDIGKQLAHAFMTKSTTEDV